MRGGWILYFHGDDPYRTQTTREHNSVFYPDTPKGRGLLVELLAKSIACEEIRIADSEIAREWWEKVCTEPESVDMCRINRYVEFCSVEWLMVAE